MRNAEERELAAQCLELATSREHGDPVKEAARYLDFVLGKFDPEKCRDDPLNILRAELRRIDPDNARLRFVDELYRV
ncbi:MAG: hypothetical protein ABS87_00905 [Sphingomonas sp. SCN 67-18]|nr:MAG: hypothetical protein ABS87_00905 [Sphingomonas sp. SCN 67-18]